MRMFANPTLRPFVLLLLLVLLFSVADLGQQRFLSAGTAFSVLQQLATLGPVALGLGLTMIAREYDLSVGGMMSLAGCIAVMTGVANPFLGIALAVLAGLTWGGAQGLVMVRLNLSSVGVTLGGLLTTGGIAYVLTDNSTIGYARLDIAMLVNQPLLVVFSLRNLVALAAFAIAAFVCFHTRLGRDLVATGSDRRAALFSGVPVGAMLTGTFALSGGLSALTGALLSYSLAAASPVALTDALIPATAAAIIGGVSLTGGKGTPLGIAGGVLVLSVLRSGLTALGLPPFAVQIVTGLVLLAVALADSSGLHRQIYAMRRRLRR